MESLKHGIFFSKTWNLQNMEYFSLRHEPEPEPIWITLEMSFLNPFSDFPVLFVFFMPFIFVFVLVPAVWWSLTKYVLPGVDVAHRSLVLLLFSRTLCLEVLKYIFSLLHPTLTCRINSLSTLPSDLQSLHTSVCKWRKFSHFLLLDYSDVCARLAHYKRF